MVKQKHLYDKILFKFVIMTINVFTFYKGSLAGYENDMDISEIYKVSRSTN